MIFTVSEILCINDVVEAGQCALFGMEGACLEGGRAGLVPEGDAGVVVLALVPAMAFVVGIFVG